MFQEIEKAAFISIPHEDVLHDAAPPRVANVNRFFSKERPAREAAHGECERLARELHDGVLQSLAGAKLQLEALARLIDKDPVAAHERIRAIEQLITEEQRELRALIRDFKPAPREAMASSSAFADALQTLCRRAEESGKFQVRLSVAARGTMQRAMSDEIYRFVQEALNNVAKHAQAEFVRVNIAILRDRVRIVVADDGRGFPFRGRYDLAALDRLNLGPASLKERVASLHGALVLTSLPSGSLLEFTLPLEQDVRMDSPPSDFTAERFGTWSR